MTETFNPQFVTLGHQGQDGDQLYQINFEKAVSQIVVYGKKQHITLSGQALISGLKVHGKLRITAIHDFALMSERIAELAGEISLAGPTAQIKIEPGLVRGVAPLDLRLYYPLLSKLPPAFEEDGIIYPQLEAIRGRLYWEVLPPPHTPRLRLILEMDKQIEVAKGGGRAVDWLAFEVITELVLLESEEKDGEWYYGGQVEASRVLYLNFVDHVTDLTQETERVEKKQSLKELAQTLLYEANQVWLRQDGLLINSPTGDFDPQDDQPIYSAGDTPPKISVRDQEDPQCIPVRLKSSGISTEKGGGKTYNAGTDKVYIDVDTEKALKNKYLLAHEIGHVFRLHHPTQDNPPSNEGSWCSVMVPDDINSGRNTNHNLHWVTSVKLPLPLNSIKQLKSASPSALPESDEVFSHHMIRRFPYDDGSPCSEAHFNNWDPQSDIWNWNNSDVNSVQFKQDNSPKHEEPKRNIDNFLYVKLSACQIIHSAVQVFLFLVYAKNPTDTLSMPSVSPFNKPPLCFKDSNRPGPQKFRIQRVSWQVPRDWPPKPPGWPSNELMECWVVAVSRSGEDPPSRTEKFRLNPSSFTFAELQDLAMNFNNLALRKLKVTPPLPT